MSKAIIFAAALIFTPLPALCEGAQQSKIGEAPSYTDRESMGESGGRGQLGNILDRLSQSQLKEDLASAMERIEDACGAEIEELCGDITPGEGRIALCVRAKADQLSRRCRFTLFRVSRQIRQSVSNIADECLNGLKAQCGNAQKIGECAEQKSASISPACYTVVAALRRAGQKLASLKGMPVFSSDNRDLGRVVDVTRAPDGKIQSVQIQIGRFLGLGDKVVTIDAGQLEQLADQIRLRLNGDQVRALPEAKRSGF
jgi:sporulation protein YlmC with PRC-barrel domain